MRNGIKKYVIASIPIIFGCLFGISNGVEITNSCVRYANSNYNCYEVEPGESYTLKGYELTISNNLTFSSDSIQNILLTKFTSNSNKNYTTSLFWNGNSLYHSVGHEGNGGTIIWQLSGAYVSDSTQYTGVVNSLANQTLNIQPIGDILQTINGHGVSRIVYMLRADFQAYPYYCFIYDDIDYSFCVSNDGNNQGGTNNSVWNLYLEKKTGAEIYNTPSELVNYLTTTYGISESPITVGGGGETTINYACPTIQQLINTYPNQYNTGLCYSSSLIFSGGTIQQVEPKDIFTLYPLYTGFVADINLYNNYCVGPNTQTACETAFQGKTEQYTLISKIPDNVKKANLYAYCNLQLNYEDKNASTCVISGAINTGEYIPPITNQGVIDELIDGDYNIVLPASGYVMDTLKDENGERKIDWNIIESIQNLYTKFTTIFTGREGNNGIIPEYITRMILIIILFAFFKK